jgi:2-C-methyl-D-erythritol 4-phosphate cytidylyltransferase
VTESNTHTRHWLVIPAAGIGQRMKADRPKQYLRIHNRYLLDITVSRLLDAFGFDGCILALDQGDSWWLQTESAADARIRTCKGGVERRDTVAMALEALASCAAPDDWVLVHDVARPCVHPDDLHVLIAALKDHPVGGLLACPVGDTLKRAGADSEVLETLDRRGVWRALTPQMFRFGRLKQALAEAGRRGVLVTDEASAMEAMGEAPLLVQGRSDNIKVTLPADLRLAEFILSRSG